MLLVYGKAKADVVAAAVYLDPMGGRMNIRQLQYFCAVVTTGSFSRSAQEQGVSVQAVSKAIVELEDELGAPLFIRGNKGATPTSFGWELYRTAQAAVDAFGRVEQHAAYLCQSHRRSVEGRDDLRLSLIYHPFSKNELMCAGFSLLLRKRTGVRTRMTLSAGPAALQALFEGELDALITIGAFEHPRCETIKVGTLPTGVYFSRFHPLHSLSQVSYEDLAPYPALCVAEYEGFNESILDVYRAHGLASPVVACSSPEEMYDYMEHDHGYVLGVGVPALTVRPISVMHRVDPAQALSIPVVMTTVKGGPRPEVARLCESVRQGFSNLAGLFNV